jgi:hypothetical protein
MKKEEGTKRGRIKSIDTKKEEGLKGNLRFQRRALKVRSA